jgi:hypothetical protein
MFNKYNPQPIQIIGTQRSGSNLFRLMLNQLDKVIAPHPPHILQRFFPVIENYNTSNSKLNFTELAEDVCKMVELNPVELVKTEIDRNRIINNCKDQTLTSLFYSMYDYFASEENAAFWICKSMANMNFVNELEERERKPFYLHLFRDGRDVACSFKKAIVGEKHIWHLAKKWKSDQEKCLELMENVNDDRFLSIKYEQLIQDSEKEIKRVCKYLNIEYEDKYMNYHESEASKTTAKSGKMWANVGKPVMKNNFNKFKTQLSREEIIIFEHVAGDVLEKLGYQLVFPEESKAFVITDAMKAQFNKENQSLKTKAKQNIDPEGQKLRKGQQKFIAELNNKN